MKSFFIGSLRVAEKFFAPVKPLLNILSKAPLNIKALDIDPQPVADEAIKKELDESKKKLAETQAKVDQIKQKMGLKKDATIEQLEKEIEQKQQNKPLIMKFGDCEGADLINKFLGTHGSESGQFAIDNSSGYGKTLGKGNGGEQFKSFEHYTQADECFRFDEFNKQDTLRSLLWKAYFLWPCKGTKVVEFLNFNPSNGLFNNGTTTQAATNYPGTEYEAFKQFLKANGINITFRGDVSVLKESTNANAANAAKVITDIQTKLPDYAKTKSQFDAAEKVKTDTDSNVTTYFAPNKTPIIFPKYIYEITRSETNYEGRAKQIIEIFNKINKLEFREGEDKLPEAIQSEPEPHKVMFSFFLDLGLTGWVTIQHNSKPPTKNMTDFIKSLQATRFVKQLTQIKDHTTQLKITQTEIECINAEKSLQFLASISLDYSKPDEIVGKVLNEQEKIVGFATTLGAFEKTKAGGAASALENLGINIPLLIWHSAMTYGGLTFVYKSAKTILGKHIIKAKKQPPGTLSLRQLAKKKDPFYA